MVHILQETPQIIKSVIPQVKKSIQFCLLQTYFIQKVIFLSVFIPSILNIILQRNIEEDQKGKQHVPCDMNNNNAFINTYYIMCCHLEH